MWQSRLALAPYLRGRSAVRRTLLTLALALLAGANTFGIVVPAQSNWRLLKGTAEASTPPHVWRQLSFSDLNWAQAPAPIHYGESIAGGTVLTDMRNRYSCIFLRRSFQVTQRSEVQEIRLRVLCDDGFIAWINGTEVARNNMPPGEPLFNGFARAAVAEPVSFLEYQIPAPAFLASGDNMLAVQVFNNSLTSSDLQWDAELEVVERDTEPPRITSFDPAPGTVEQLARVSVTFDEPVTGVQASDLLLGSEPAQQVAGSGAVYTFTFSSVPTGAIELRWEADTLITDLASPANRFDPVAAGTWRYTIIDLTAPALLEVNPRAGVTVRQLAQVELRFSEPVEGVDAADLLVNGTPASSLVLTPTGSYLFKFPQPPPGQVRFSWAPNHNIVDHADPAHVFNDEGWWLSLDPNSAPPPVRINEILASSMQESGLRDEDNELQDWIELRNVGAVAVPLEGWSLTDDRDDLDRWVFPAVSIGPGQHLVVFASGKDRRPSGPGARLHTNFRLNPSGEYLALLGPESPRVVVSEFAPEFPEQRNDFSFGPDATGQLRYFHPATPGAPNGSSASQGVVPPPQFSVERGWFDAPFTLEISSALPGTLFRYTLDGREPTAIYGQTYTEPLRIARTTVLRVAGFKADTLPSAVSSHTYIFSNDVLGQPNNPPGYPAGARAWGGYPSDYEMDPEIVANPLYQGLLKQALAALPTLSLVCPVSDLFGDTNGIYTHPTSRGPAWERPCSAEFMPNDGSEGFAVNAGLQIQGNASREPQKQPKHAFRLLFKGDYGPRRLEFPLFPDTRITQFDTLVLRADFNFSWLHWNPHQRIRAQRTRDAWVKDTLRAMGGLTTHNRYVHLFLNGLYWGIYDPSERPDGAFAASAFGGEKEQYDVMNEGAVVDGGRAAYDRMLALGDVTTRAGFSEMQRYLDLPQFIDYMLLHFYVAHQDWGQNKNWYAVRPKDGSRGFFYLPWDGEMILDDVNHNRVSSADTPSGLHTKLVTSAEYRLAFGDRVQKHLFNGGALTPDFVQAAWLKRAREVELAIVAESARWGDYRRDVHQFQSGPYDLYTRDNQWRAEQNRLLTEYFPRRTAILMGQLRAGGLYPEVAAPVLSRQGGRVAPGFTLTMSATAGTVYFTLDGTDPRVPFTGTIAGAAREYRDPLELTQTVRVKARAWRQGTWSALTEADFQVGFPRWPVRISEIMYHPPGGDAFEFLELHHGGEIPVDLGGFSISGIDYVFPHRTILAPGEVMVLASALSPAAFAARYPGVHVAGYFAGALSNGGERLVLRDPQGRGVAATIYADSAAWPVQADGGGSSLELVDRDQDPNAPASWRASAALHGSPGVHRGNPQAPVVQLNELLARPNSDLEADWVELANVSAASVSLAGWSLADETGVFTFPDGAALAPGALVLVWCGADNSGTPGFHAPFRLAQEGETLVLRDAQGLQVDAVSYGLQVPGFALGRVGPAASWQLTVPTPAAPNAPAPLATAANLRLNEWLANSQPGEDDWLEIFNPDPARPACLHGLGLETDTALFQITSHSFVAPGGFVKLQADERSGPDHLGFKLPAGGGFIALLGPDGRTIDQVVYGPQAEDLSEGRLVDGGPEIGVLPLGPSPGRSNVAPPPEADRDQDGLPDAWEMAHGTNADLPDASADPDQDGLSNAQEFRAGTDPRDGKSTLQISQVRLVGPGVALEFPAMAGRTYTIYYSDALTGGSWRKLVDIAAPAVDRKETTVDPSFGEAARFYRLVTPSQP